MLNAVVVVDQWVAFPLEFLVELLSPLVVFLVEGFNGAIGAIGHVWESKGVEVVAGCRVTISGVMLADLVKTRSRLHVVCWLAERLFFNHSVRWTCDRGKVGGRQKRYAAGHGCIESGKGSVEGSDWRAVWTDVEAVTDTS